MIKSTAINWPIFIFYVAGFTAVQLFFSFVLGNDFVISLALSFGYMVGLYNGACGWVNKKPNNTPAQLC